MGLPVVSTVVESWHLFSAKERRNIALYILGIMLYKFGLEGKVLFHLKTARNHAPFFAFHLLIVSSFQRFHHGPCH